jgi:hypothetical protein
MSTTILDTPEQIQAARLLALKYRFKLELKGLKFKGRTSYSIIKSEFGLKGSRQSVYEQFVQLVEQRLYG